MIKVKLPSALARIYIQLDWRLMKIKDWLWFRRMATAGIREFYAADKVNLFYTKAISAEEVHDSIESMDHIYPKLTKIFKAIHEKKISDPIEGFKSGKYDLLRRDIDWG